MPIIWLCRVNVGRHRKRGDSILTGDEELNPESEHETTVVLHIPHTEIQKNGFDCIVHVQICAQQEIFAYTI